jgi:hypothetical protein
LKRCATRRYTRELDQPIEWIALVGLPGSSEEEKEKWLQEAVDRVHRERCRKLELLKKELGLRTGPFGDFPLAIWLATEYVRGFRLLHPDDRRRRGRRRGQWPHGQYIGLLVDVDKIKEVSRVRTNRAALRELVRRPNDYFDGQLPRSSDVVETRVRSLNARLTDARRFVKEQDLEFMFAPEHRDLLRRVFAPGSTQRKLIFV